VGHTGDEQGAAGAAEAGVDVKCTRIVSSCAVGSSNWKHEMKVKDRLSPDPQRQMTVQPSALGASYGASRRALQASERHVDCRSPQHSQPLSVRSQTPRCAPIIPGGVSSWAKGAAVFGTAASAPTLFPAGLQWQNAVHTLSMKTVSKVLAPCPPQYQGTSLVQYEC
jgi:hypothetical protein